MLRKLVFSFFGLACAQWATATVQFYDNAGVVQAPPDIPPSIDAVNFINRNTFTINFTNFYPTPYPVTTPPYNTSNTRTFTNGPSTTAFMSCNAGFDFESFFPSSNQIKRASIFFNAGTIDCGTVNTSNQFNINTFTAIGNPAKMIVSATNIINPGTINMGFETLLSLKGESVDLTRGGFAMEGSGLTANGLISANIFDGYWGLGDPVTQRPLFYPNGIMPDFYWATQPYNTPFHIVTNRVGATVIQSLGFTTNFLGYLSDQTAGSNRTVRAAFVGSTNSALQVNVYFPGGFAGGSGDIIVEYTNVTSSHSLGIATTNNLYLQDVFGLRTNFQLLPLNVISVPGSTFRPFNYTFSLTQPLGLGTPTPSSVIPFGTFGGGNVTNRYSAYEAIFSPTSELLSDAAGQDVTNLPGRIEVTADKVLNLTRARIGSLNYLSLKGTNHYVGSTKAQISSPFTDLNLRSTNGTLAVTNVVAPFVLRPEGTIDCFSARWTNVDVGTGITNAFHVLFVDTKLAPNFPSRVETAILRANNAPGGSSDSLIISDNLNITRTLLLDAVAVTLTTNEPSAQNPYGTINLLSSDILWSSSAPRLKYLTNNGAIQTLNAVFFGGARSSPYYNSNFDEPYIEFINRGIVTNYGSLIWALDFQNIGNGTNTGIFYANSGSIDLEKARTTTLLNGAFLAPLGDITVATDTLLVSNHLFQTGGSLNLYVTNTIDDGSLTSHDGNVVSNKNIWFVTSGFSLPLRPAQGSLLGTVVNSTASAFVEVINQWGAADYGCSSSGFTSGVGSAPLGSLTLDGGQDSQFTFIGTGPGANAIYVDYLEFKDFTTNRDSAGNFIGVGIAPNMTIYFANAVANGVSIAEKLNGKFGADGASGGHFCWVSGYAGAFSSVTRTNLNDGTPYQVNAALATDCNLDTDGDGIANCVDPDPLHPPPGFAAAQLALAVAMTNSPMRAAVVSWNTTASSTNFVYYKTMMSTNWQLLTNFISGPAGSRINVLDPVSGAGRLYRVRVDAPH